MAQMPKIVVPIIGISLLLGACSDKLGARNVAFAECLTQKGIKMYGAYWCPHCADQKKLFGKQAFEKITYIECDPRGEGANPKLCLEKNIKGYPTWEFPDGSQPRGVIPLAGLAEKTGCILPPPDIQ